MTIKLQLWDTCKSLTTAGSERFAVITNSHYRGAVGAILMYDVTEKKSFDQIPKWLKDAREKADPSVQILLIRKILTEANKCDITNKNPREREVNETEAKEFAAKNELLYAGETSAMMNINIHRCIEELAKKINSK